MALYHFQSSPSRLFFILSCNAHHSNSNWNENCLPLWCKYRNIQWLCILIWNINRHLLLLSDWGWECEWYKERNTQANYTVCWRLEWIGWILKMSFPLCLSMVYGWACACEATQQSTMNTIAHLTGLLLLLWLHLPCHFVLGIEVHWQLHKFYAFCAATIVLTHRTFQWQIVCTSSCLIFWWLLGRCKSNFILTRTQQNLNWARKKHHHSKSSRAAAAAVTTEDANQK